MTPVTRRTPGVRSPGFADDIAGGSVNVDCTPDRRRLTAVAIGLAAVSDVTRPHLPEHKQVVVDVAVSDAVTVLLAIESVLCRPDVDPRVEEALSIRWAELAGGGS